ncbi:MAG: hypothetical protein KAH20_16360 [Methylococcales bacterium]|nr:hypothetical protein [Methylococcales bacterium]
MKKYSTLIYLFTILLVISPSSNAVEKQTVKNKNTSSSVIKITTSGNTYISDKTKKNDSIDGSTSASQLRAKRSHAVSKQDETGLAIFFGLIVLSVIIVVLKPFSERK